MDKKSITGLVLIFLILIGFYWINQPSEADKLRWQAYHDSLQRVEALRLDSINRAQASQAAASLPDTATADSAAQAAAMNARYGLLASSVEGREECTSVETANAIFTFSSRGARIRSVTLKDFNDAQGRPVVLFDGSRNEFGFTFVHNNRAFNTNDLYFRQLPAAVTDTTTTVIFSLPVGDGSLDYVYTLRNDSCYLVDFGIRARNLGNSLSINSSAIDINWVVDMLPLEKARQLEVQNSGIFYRFHQADVESISGKGDFDDEIRQKIDWIAFKGQFFSSILIADESFGGASLRSISYSETDTLLSRVSAKLGVPFNFDNGSADFHFYFGPNKYSNLKSLGDAEYTELIPLGWGIFGWLNRWVIIPVFDYLEQHIASYGLIILLLTLLIKLVLFPFTYGSYKSSAKMKVLRPQIDEINARIPAEKAMERQQATMNLYKKAGVSPLGGCLPMLLQMPILLAAFRFFPASFELRQKGFLWADDLSTYDSILDLPFSIPFYGDHVSLFCLLMSLINIAYTKLNSEMTQSSQQMPGMKVMMYMMPVIFLFFFNGYASGLCYYYFISTLITVAQTVIIRKFFIDEEAILAKLKANQKKPVRKSKWAQRIEEMARQQQQRRR